MDYLQILKADIKKGYSKADLERLIGLPQNCLSGVIKGSKKLSKKSQIKIENWEKSDKLNPLETYFKKPEVKVTDLTKPTIEVKPLTDPKPKTNFTINTSKKQQSKKQPFMSDAIKKKLGI